MSESDPRQAALRSNAAQLARILDTSDAAQQSWLPEDLPDLLRHQWSAPIEFDLAEVPQKNRDKTLTGAVELRIQTFGDLLEHPGPSLALLKLAKDFFKDKAKGSKEGRQERQIAYLFYVLVILAARVRLGTAISSLSNAELEQGIKWAVGQSWVKGEPRKLLVQLASAMPGK